MEIAPVIVQDWPCLMSAETAAAYCDEPSARAFRDKVKKRQYPQPCSGSGKAARWARKQFDDLAGLPRTYPETTAEDDM